MENIAVLLQKFGNTENVDNCSVLMEEGQAARTEAIYASES